MKQLAHLSFVIVVITSEIFRISNFCLATSSASMKSYIMDRNDFFNKLRSLQKLSFNVILCTVDIVGLYPNIPQKECLSALRKRLDNRKKQELEEAILRANLW